MSDSAYPPWSISPVGRSGAWATYRLLTHVELPAATPVEVSVSHAGSEVFREHVLIRDRAAFITLKPPADGESEPVVAVTWSDDGQPHTWTTALP